MGHSGKSDSGVQKAGFFTTLAVSARFIERATNVPEATADDLALCRHDAAALRQPHHPFLLRATPATNDVGLSVTGEGANIGQHVPTPFSRAEIPRRMFGCLWIV